MIQRLFSYFCIGALVNVCICTSLAFMPPLTQDSTGTVVVGSEFGACSLGEGEDAWGLLAAVATLRSPCRTRVEFWYLPRVACIEHYYDFKDLTFVPDWADVEPQMKDAIERVDGVLESNAIGWPARAFQSTHSALQQPDSETVQISIQHGVSAGTRITGLDQLDEHFVALPTHPIWSGVATNTLTFALVTGIAHMLFISAVRSNRRRKSHCLQCGYILDKLTNACPECGANMENRT